MLIPEEKIDRSILLIRGQKVMLDADLAVIYGISTSRLNEQVKRNKDRLPDDFMFQQSDNEKAEVIANCDHLEKLKFSRTNPYAFSEHGTMVFQAIRELMQQQTIVKKRPQIGYKIGQKSK